MHPAWSLLFELLVGMVFAFAVAALTPARTVVACVVALGLTAVGICYAGNADIGYQPGFEIFGLARALFSFLVGTLIVSQQAMLRRWLARLPPHATSLVLVVCLTFIPLLPPGLPSMLYDLAMIGLVYPVLVALATEMPVKPWEARMMRVLGLISFPIYVFHYPVAVLLSELLQTSLGVDVHTLAPFAGVLLLLGLCGLSYWMAVAVDLPLRSWLRGSLERPPRLLPERAD
jgi:peptidoglycan/LPS O-acetylase OafA/YrhL